MAEEYKAYLAAHVLNEGQIVTYRSLSRALKIHNNVAKKMLYEFHRQQSSKKPGSVHAIYLLSGNIRIQEVINANTNKQGDGEDEPMQSSPFMSSYMPHTNGDEEVLVKKVITIVREEHLEVARANYDELSSIHVYSLGPSYIQNIQILSDCTREIFVACAKEDPLEVGRQYGVIQNQWVKRRTKPRPGGITTSSSIVSEAVSKAFETKAAAAPDSQSKSGSKTADRPVLDSAIKQERSKSTAKKQAYKPPTTKREPSDIFKAFSKSKPKLERRDTASSVDTTPAVATPVSEVHSNPEDEPMKDASEDEQEEDLILTSSKSTTSRKGTKAEREEKLRQMMEDDDEPMDNSAEASPDEATFSQPITSAQASQEDPVSASEPPVVISGGRRRGRRKVIKKKTLKDEEGYLVTKEEPAWESFSEDEPPPTAPSASAKAKQPPASASAATGKGKKAAGKPGQGNIMSFFGRK